MKQKKKFEFQNTKACQIKKYIKNFNLFLVQQQTLQYI